jgi:hypothetical protein
VAEFTIHSRVRDVVAERPDGRELLYRHGLNLGEGFVDYLSQYETLEEAAREGRLRDLDGLLLSLNNASHK